MSREDGGTAEPVLAQMHHHWISSSASADTSYEWEVSTPWPFDELIVTWNALRPNDGSYSLFLSVEVEGRWSPFYLYSRWGASGQSGGDAADLEFGLRIFQDTLEQSPGRKAARFRVRVEADGSAAMGAFRSLHACVSQVDAFQTDDFIKIGETVNLNVPLVSQFALPHLRKRDLCSPTSASAVVGYLKNTRQADPVAFANGAHDNAHDIFGNWVLNAAHASDLLGEGWSCWVQRLSGFGPVYASLLKNIPVVVSVKGELSGAPFAYPNGHLIVVKGFLPETAEVVCMDPALPSDGETDVRYGLADFMEVWSKRRCLAYVFSKM